MEGSNANRILVVKHFVKRPFARSKKRRKANINTDTRQVNSEDGTWMKLTCDCVKLQVLLSVTCADTSSHASRTGNDQGSSNCVRLQTIS
jgi:hypothetical protein